MEIKERIRRYLDEHGEPPWPCADPTTMSQKALLVWGSLTDEEKIAISRFNRFLIERNAVLQELRDRGLTTPILAEISSVSVNQVKRVTRRAKRADPR